MVSNALFYQVHQRLSEIFLCDSNIPFAGLPVFICGDYYQLPPVRGLPVAASLPSMKGYLSLDLLTNFGMAELTEVMRQKGDSNFISRLNKIRKGEIDSNIRKALTCRFVNKNDLSYPAHSVHIFAENNPAGEHNREILNELNSPLYTINTIDKILPETKRSKSHIEAINTRKISEAGNLTCKLEIQNGAQVMITTNINSEDRLMNALVGSMIDI